MTMSIRIKLLVILLGFFALIVALFYIYSNSVTINYRELRPLKEFTMSMKNEIDKFADGAGQADDMAMLVFRYCGV